MRTLVVELYNALRKAGVDEALAVEAASAVVPASAMDEMAMRRDLEDVRLAMKADLSELKADLIKWNVGTMVALTALCAAIMRLG